MIYRITHRTTYKYKHPVSVGSHVACLKPRSLAHQQVLKSELHIEPEPTEVIERLDYFGNTQQFFALQDPHEELVVEARSEVRLCNEAATWMRDSPPWEDALAAFANDHSEAGREAFQFKFESPRIRQRPEFVSFALESFTPRRPIHEALVDLTTRIHNDFQFDTKVTNVRTPIEEVFRKRRGVCQDFAHVQIACLRSMNLAARYVSGYLRTYPPEGKERLVGADASHAWLSAYCPGIGWLDLDPTNDVVPSNDHVTIAWGRDYGDVSPLHGLILGGGGHALNVAVDMEALDA